MALAASALAHVPEPRLFCLDAADNLLRRTNNTLTQTFNTDSLNQLSSGTLTVAGVVTRPASSVTANGQPAALYNDQTWATTAGLSLSNGTNTFTVNAQAVSGGSAASTLTLNLPATVEMAVFGPPAVLRELVQPGGLIERDPNVLAFAHIPVAMT